MEILAAFGLLGILAGGIRGIKVSRLDTLRFKILKAILQHNPNHSNIPNNTNNPHNPNNTNNSYNTNDTITLIIPLTLLIQDLFIQDQG